MAIPGYFSYFNKTKYSFEDKNLNRKTVVNILNRSSFLRELTSNIDAYYNFTMKETDNPEIVADNYYGSPQQAWIILLFNRIMDPYYSFPLTREELEKYIVNKYAYSSINTAFTEIHHYELVTTITEYVNGVVNSKTETSVEINENEVNFATGRFSTRASLPAVDESLIVETKSVALSASTSVSYQYKVKAVSVYTHEDTLNENKRNIKLLRKEFVNRVETEFRRLMV